MILLYQTWSQLNIATKEKYNVVGSKICVNKGPH